MSLQEKLQNDERFQIVKRNEEDFFKPYVIEDFISLEGEGGDNAVGLSTLFVRLNKCNCSCTFCDTSFSIPGNPKFNKCRADNQEIVDYLSEKYTNEDKEMIHSCSITGGEPLMHLESFENIINGIEEVFPNITHIIIETNGNLLHKIEHCVELLKLDAKFKNIHFTLSISPKLNGKVSYAKKYTEDEIMEIYKKVFYNYYTYLSSVGIQVKFVHKEELISENEKLMDFLLEKKYIPSRTKILIMPWTPARLDTPEMIKMWSDSKDSAARYALKKYFRYSPRIHIDRKMD